MLQYYTLEEAVKVLGTTAEEGKTLLDEHKIKQFRDGRGKVRYVASAVDLLARTMGRGSDPEMQLGEAPASKSGNASSTRVDEAEVFDFALGTDDSDEVTIGQAPIPKPGDSRKGSGRTPAPKPSSDSDVRLVADGSELDFNIKVDSDVKMVDEVGPRSGKHTQTQPVADLAADSGIRMVPMDDLGLTSESTILGEQPEKKHSDSDIRLEAAKALGDGSDDALITEEIDLDAEARKAEATVKPPRGKKVQATQQSMPPLPTQSPFELSDIDLPAGAGKKSKAPASSDSSDFDLTPEGDSGSLELSPSELRAMPAAGDDLDLGAPPPAGKGNSGINLQSPADSGISLEGGDSSEELEFELSLDEGSTPKPSGQGKGKGKAKPAPAKDEADSDSGFELSLESSGDSPAIDASDSGSDSEFELTLDDSGSLKPLESSDPSASAEGDIFETDFEVPALDEESGSEAVALEDSDTDLESSEFDLALGEEDMASDDESGSQVVAIEDEESVDDSAETVNRPRKKGQKMGLVSGDEDVGEMLDEDAADVAVDDEDEPARAPVGAGRGAEQPWGNMPALVLFPCVVVMVLAGLMGLELIKGMFSYHQTGKVSGFLVDTLAQSFTSYKPK